MGANVNNEVIMKDQSISAPSRRTTEIDISAALVVRAKEIGVNVSQAAEQWTEDAVAKRMGELLLEENLLALVPVVGAPQPTSPA